MGTDFGRAGGTVSAGMTYWVYWILENLSEGLKRKLVNLCRYESSSQSFFPTGEIAY